MTNGDPRAKARDETPRIAILASMAIEAEAIRGCLDDAQSLVADSRQFEWGLLGGVPVVVAVTGPGKVNAALTTQALFERFLVTDCVLVGVAGSILTARIGDVVVGTEACYSDYGQWDEAGIVPSDVLVGFPPAEPTLRVRHFASDPTWITELGAAAAAVRDAPGAHESFAVVFGGLATGDQFMSAIDRRSVIAKETGAHAVDMETAAVAQVALLNDIPFGALRTVSDNADGTGVADFERFARQSAQRAAQILTRAVAALTQRPLKPSVVYRGRISVEPRRVALELPLPSGEGALRLTSAEVRRIVGARSH